VLFVYDTNADTKGLLYPRALQQVFVGLYIAELCLVGLFALQLSKSKGTIGPFVMMILLIVVTALFHVSLNSALGPLLKYLPKTLDAEERRLAVAEREAAETGKELSPETSIILSPKHKKPNFIVKFLKPQVYNDYTTMRRLVPEMVDPEDDVEAEFVHDAYLPPAGKCSIDANSPLLPKLTINSLERGAPAHHSPRSNWHVQPRGPRIWQGRANH
jgi:hypothetical protein